MRLAALASNWRLSRLVRERWRFLARQARGAPAPGRYRLAGTDVAFYVRHRSPDLNTLEQVVAERHYELPPEAAQALAGLGHPPRVVDLGANIGLFSAEMLARFPGARVVAFEPDPANAELVERAIAANGPQADWALVKACAGTADGEVRFRAGDFANSRIAAADEPAIPVAVRDVFAYLDDVDVLKIDIEGAEWPILADPRFDRVPATLVALEFHPGGAPGDPTEAAESALRDAGYHVRPGELESPPGHGMVWGWKRG